MIGETTTVGDGSRLATTKLRYTNPDGSGLRTYSLSWFASEKNRDSPVAMTTYVEWSPTGKHVLVRTRAAVAVHDFETGTFTVHEEAGPVAPMSFGAPLWRPDGAGFLATYGGEDDENDLLFVTLDGEARRFNGPKIDVNAIKDMWPIGQWKGDTLVSHYGASEYRIDTKKFRIELVRHESPRKHTWRIGKATLELVRERKGRRTIVWTDGDERVVVTRDPGKAFTMPSGPVVPSPDGRSAVVVTRKGLVLVDESGVVDRIPVTPDGDEGNDDGNG